MIAQLIEMALPSIIGIMVHRKESLTQKERKAQEAFIKSLHMGKRLTEKQIVVAIVGLVGSGKSSVAKELAKLIGATVVEGDEIRVQLRKVDERYEGARKIGENATFEILIQGGNVVLDSDYSDQKKRASLREKLKGMGVELIFIRTHVDVDTMVGRVITADYQDKPGDFFGGASSSWKGPEQSKGAAVKIREMWRRTPHHYRWSTEFPGGSWVLKKLPFKIFAEIDTTDPVKWKKEVKKVVEKLLKI